MLATTQKAKTDQTQSVDSEELKILKNRIERLEARIADLEIGRYHDLKMTYKVINSLGLVGFVEIVGEMGKKWRAHMESLGWRIG